MQASQALQPLWTGFRDSAAAFPDRPAVEANGETLTYAELSGRATRIAATLAKYTPAAEPALSAVFAYRSATGVCGRARHAPERAWLRAAKSNVPACTFGADAATLPDAA